MDAISRRTDHGEARSTDVEDLAVGHRSDVDSHIIKDSGNAKVLARFGRCGLTLWSETKEKVRGGRDYGFDTCGLLHEPSIGIEVHDEVLAGFRLDVWLVALGGIDTVREIG